MGRALLHSALRSILPHLVPIRTPSGMALQEALPSLALNRALPRLALSPTGQI